MKRLQSIPGVVIPEPDGAFYALPDMTAFFGPDAEADDFGSIQDADTLCRQATRDCSFSCYLSPSNVPYKGIVHAARVAAQAHAYRSHNINCKIA